VPRDAKGRGECLDVDRSNFKMGKEGQEPIEGKGTLKNMKSSTHLTAGSTS